MENNKNISINDLKDKISKGEVKDSKELLENLKNNMNITDDQLNKLKDIASQYTEKSEEELLFDIVNLNRKISGDGNNDDFEKKLKKLEKIRPLLNEEQSQKLDKVLEVLKQNK